MPNSAKTWFLAATMLLLCLSESVAQSSAEPSSESLRVAVREVPPFALRDNAGQWTGLSIQLWDDIAQSLGWEFEYQELPLRETIDALASGAVDAAPVALTMTAEREERIDFSHPYFVGGLAVAHLKAEQQGWLAVLRGFASREFLGAVGALALVLLLAGAAVWLFERRANPDEFGEHPLRGLGNGFWWSAVTMTTVGYGDKSPRTVGGRVVALIWMFASLIIIAGFTASIAASLTANQLGQDLLRDRPLSKLTVGVLAGSSAEQFANSAGSTVRSYPTLEGAANGVRDGEVEVVLHDAPILQYMSRTDQPWLTVAPGTLVREDFGIGLAPGSRFREVINGHVLSLQHDDSWAEAKRRYLGDGTGGD